MAITENDIGLVLQEDFEAHAQNEDLDIQHVTATEKTMWNGKADASDLSDHAESVVLDHPDGSVTEAKIADGAIKTSHIQASAVTREKINNGAVDADKLAVAVKNNIDSKQESSARGQANGYAPLDANAKIPEQYIYGKTAKEYGMRWLGTSDPSCVRLGDAVGLTATAYRGSAQPYHSDFDSIYPWSDMKLCNIDKNGHILAYIGEPSFKRDGSNGDVMVEIPKFYYKRKQLPAYDEFTSKGEEWWICAEKLPGYELHPAFTDNGEEIHRLFVSAYDASIATDENELDYLESKSGVEPVTGILKKVFREAAQAKNSGATAAERRVRGWGIEDYACCSAIQMLFVIEFANMSSRSILGSGIRLSGLNEYVSVAEASALGNEVIIPYSKKDKFPTDSYIQIGTQYLTPDVSQGKRTVLSITSDSTANTATITFNGPPIATDTTHRVWTALPNNGLCDFLNGKSGSDDNEYYKDVCYRGIEGIFGKLNLYIDGIGRSAQRIYYSNNMADYTEFTSVTPSSAYTQYGKFMPNTDGYIAEFCYDEYAPWILVPSDTQGSSTKYITDYFHYSGGAHNLRFGQAEGSSVNGLFNLDGQDTLPDTRRNGVHLMFKK